MKLQLVSFAKKINIPGRGMQSTLMAKGPNTNDTADLEYLAEGGFVSIDIKGKRVGLVPREQVEFMVELEKVEQKKEEPKK